MERAKKDRILKKFMGIKKERWTIGSLHRRKVGQACALGHLGVYTYKNLTQDAKDLIELWGGLTTKSGTDEPWYNTGMVTRFNDGYKAYGFDNPKDSIICKLIKTYQSEDLPLQ